MIANEVLTEWQILKEAADEMDLGTQYHLTRYAFLYETMTVSDGMVLNPLGSPEEGRTRHLFCESG